MVTDKGRGKPSSCRLPPPRRELGPGSPSRDRSPTQGWWRPDLLISLEAGMTGKLGERGRNGLKVRSNQTWSWAAGAWGPGGGRVQNPHDDTSPLRTPHIPALGVSPSNHPFAL